MSQEGNVKLLEGKNWKKRYLVVTATQVEIKKKKKDKKDKSPPIPLSNISSVTVAADGKKKHIVKATLTNGETMQFTVDSEAEATKFQKALTPASGAAKPAAPSAPGSAAGAAKPARKPCLEDYAILRVLGDSQVGKVLLVRSRIDGNLYAMKSLSKKGLAEADKLEQTIVEKNLLVSNRSPFLMTAYCSFQTVERIFMVMEYVPGGELFARLKEEGTFEEQRVKLYAAEIALGLGCLHSHKCVYRDLRPENILVDAEGHLRIINFGMTKSNLDVGGTTQTFCGTPEYIAPEILQQKPYGKDVDWWSYGILVYEMLNGIPPFYDENISVMYRNIVTAPVVFTSSRVSEEAKDFVLALLDRNPQTRLGSGEADVNAIKGHKWFSGIDWNAVENKKVKPAWVPTIRSETDTSNFDAAVTQQDAVLSFEESSAVPQEAQNCFQNFTFTDTT